MSKVNPSDLSKLDGLIDELLKVSPDEGKLKKMMAEVEIPFCADPIERMNRVLMALHPQLKDPREVEA